MYQSRPPTWGLAFFYVDIVPHRGGDDEVLTGAPEMPHRISFLAQIPLDILSFLC